jgi:hypothetical protein
VQYQQQFQEIPYRLIFTDENGIDSRIITGSFFVSSSSLSGNVGQLAGGDFSFEGNGAYRIIKCSAEIGDIEITMVGDDVTFTITGITGTPDHYVFQIDSGYEQLVPGNPFTLVDVAGGLHQIRITPICAGDERGQEVERDFEVITSVVCSPVTGFSITDIGNTFFTVNYVIPIGGIDVKIYVKNLSTGDQPFYLANGTSKTISGLTPGTDYKVTVMTNCADGISSAGVEATATTTISTVDFNTILLFDVTTTTIGEGVVGKVTFNNAYFKFEFNKIVGWSGTPITMYIQVYGNPRMKIDFPNDYLGKTFRFTDSDAVPYVGSFTPGIVNFH